MQYHLTSCTSKWGDFHWYLSFYIHEVWQQIRQVSSDRFIVTFRTETTCNYCMHVRRTLPWWHCTDTCTCTLKCHSMRTNRLSVKRCSCFKVWKADIIPTLFNWFSLSVKVYLFPQRVQIAIILANQDCVLIKFKIWLALGSSLNLKTLCTVVFWKYPAPATFKFNRPNQWLLSGSHYFWMDKSNFLKFSRCSLICIFTLS